MVNDEDETLRQPTNLDRDAILRRLVKLREAAKLRGFADWASALDKVEGMPSAQLGAAVIAAITLVQEKPECDEIAKQISLFALNLKNLK
ncbi:MAG: hypothetical protein ABI654_12880 [Betaproteobacteria bacterium]